MKNLVFLAQKSVLGFTWASASVKQPYIKGAECPLFWGDALFLISQLGRFGGNRAEYFA
jgi:hypothetical protein